MKRNHYKPTHYTRNGRQVWKPTAHPITATQAAGDLIGSVLGFANGLGAFGIIMIVMAWLSISAARDYLDMPVATFSVTTGECVSVDTKTGPISCADLPDRYTTSWTD